MQTGPPFSIRTFIVINSIFVPLGMSVGAALLVLIGRMVGFGFEPVLVTMMLAFPVGLFASLCGFYRFLNKFYGLRGPEKLFFRGRI